MITLTPALHTALKSGYMPIVVAIVSNGATLRVYGKTLPTLGSSSAITWNGSWLVGEGTFGAELGITETAARVLSFGSLETRLTYSNKDILGSFGMAELGSAQVTLDNADGHFSRILGDNSGDTFLNNGFELRLGASGLADVDFVSIFQGTITEEVLSARTLKLTADPVTPSIFETWTLPTAARYANPADQTSILPYVWGNLAENSGANGVYVCPCINTVAKIYCLAAHALPSAGNTVTLYDDDGIISSGYTTTYSGDYESQGIIAYVTMTSHTVSGDLAASVTVGKDGLTNPIDILEDILDSAGDITLRDATTWNRARNHCTEAGYVGAGMIISHNSPAYWLTDVLASFLGSWYLNSQQAIALVMSTDTSAILNVVSDARQRESNAPSGTRTRQNICNRIAIDYAVSSAKIDKRFKSDSNSQYLATDDGVTSQDNISINRHGLRSVRLGLNWTRTAASVYTLQDYVISQYANPVWTINMSDETFRLASLDAGDVIAYGWEDRIDSDGNPLTNQLARILNISKDFDALSVQLTLQDLNTKELVAPRVWNGSWLVGDGTFGYD